MSAALSPRPRQGSDGLRTLIGRLAREHSDESLDALTKRVFDELELPSKWRAVFYSLVRQAVSTRHRDMVRQHPQVGNVVELSSAKPSAQIRNAVTRPQFLRDTIETFGDWGRVPLGDMTVEMHKSRIVWQLRLAGGLKTDIDKHTDCINRIVAGGVTCLNELPEYGGKSGAAFRPEHNRQHNLDWFWTGYEFVPVMRMGWELSTLATEHEKRRYRTRVTRLQNARWVVDQVALDEWSLSAGRKDGAA